MSLFLIALLTVLSAGWITALTIRAARHLQFGVDESVGVQKIHTHWVPRLGGVPIFVAFSAGLLVYGWSSVATTNEIAALIVCVLPAFGIGLLEDVTRRVGVLVRLVFTMVAAALGWWLLGAQLTALDIPLVDGWLASSSIASFCLTMLAVAGVAHAINIVDGCNGLASSISALALAAIGVVAGIVGDEFVGSAALLAAAATFGFLVWNFPFGRIFLGDSGAYLLGFLVAELAILLVFRNPQVSPWCGLLLAVHPVWETLFSIYRRARGGLRTISQPDTLHMHQLVLRRVVNKLELGLGTRDRVVKNSLASTLIVMPNLICFVVAVVCYSNAAVLQVSAVLYAAVFCAVFRLLKADESADTLNPGHLPKGVSELSRDAKI